MNTETHTGSGEETAVHAWTTTSVLLAIFLERLLCGGLRGIYGHLTLNPTIEAPIGAAFVGVHDLFHSGQFCAVCVAGGLGVLLFEYAVLD